MSTFKGILQEFPQIRIDYFRWQPGQKAPLACFLSHVHSDHLVGLESLRAPFVYCSPATREILLRLEKYHYRVNFARGVLESRNVTYDKSMRRLAKPLPLDTPTVLELAPGNRIRVTLIDANHCIGAVMFLIEGGGNAVLYTGDIRAETWWVNSLVQNPVLLPYTLGSKRLDCIYLDTTFATKLEPYREFASKADGIRELLERVETYPSDTSFYFHSWTFGYENVWIALSNFLHSRIHLDEYRARIYASLSTLERKTLAEVGLDVQSTNKYLKESGFEVREATALCGFKQGNHVHPGCLTSRADVRIHSCERGMGCPVIDHDTDARVVHIIPIVTRTGGTEISELGAGGGKGDLDQKEELNSNDAVGVGKLMDLCRKNIEDSKTLDKVLALLQQMLDNGTSTIELDMDLRGQSQEESDMSLHGLVSVLSSLSAKPQDPDKRQNKTIRFPYSRHSSYSELCELVNAFKPRDVFPCTVDEAKWNPELGMRSLFGAYCSTDTFRHDAEMMAVYAARLERENGRGDGESQLETQNGRAWSPSPVAHKRPRLDDKAEPLILMEDGRAMADFFTPVEPHPTIQRAPSPAETSFVPETSPIRPSSTTPTPAPHEAMPAVRASAPAPLPSSTSKHDSTLSPPPPPSDHAANQPETTTTTTTHPSRKPLRTNKQLAYDAALGIYLTWADYGGLVSTKTKAEREEVEL